MNVSPIAEKIQSLPSLSEIQQKPWKFIGYRGLSEFAASDDGFLVLRQFNVLSVRVLLAMQDKLVQLEGSLAAIDNQCSRQDGPDINNGSFREDTEIGRARLTEEIKVALLEYSILRPPTWRRKCTIELTQATQNNSSTCMAL